MANSYKDEIISEKTIGIVSPFLDPARLSILNLAQIKILDKKVKNLASDVRVVAEEIRSQIDEKYDILFPLDFDIVYSAVDWKNKNSRNSFWSSIAVNFMGDKNTILPGSLYEMLKFSRRYLPAGAGGFPNHLAEQIFQAFLSAPDIRRSGDSGYPAYLKSFLDAELASRALYVIKKMQNSISSLDFNPEEHINTSLLKTCSSFLAKGSRQDRDLNNYIDAYNISLAVGLNRRGYFNQKKLVIVSNSPAMAQLGRFLSSFSADTDKRNAESTVVWSARTAAIYKLLVYRSPSAYFSVRHAWDVYGQLCGFRRELDRIREESSRQETTSVKEIWGNREENIDSILFKIVPSFDYINTLVNRWRDNLRKPVLGVKYDPEDPGTFHGGVISFIETALRRSDFEESLRRGQGTLGAERTGLDIDRRYIDPEFGYSGFLVARSGADERQPRDVFYCFRRERDWLFWVETSCKPDRFYEALKFFDLAVRESVSPNALGRKLAWAYSDEGRSDLDREKFEYVVYDDDNILEGDIPDHFNSLELTRFLKVIGYTGGRLEFLKFSTPLYTVSLEGSVVAVSGGPSLTHQIALFLRDVSDDSEGVDFESAVTRMMEMP